MKKYNVTAFENGVEVYDCDIIEANDEAEARSVAEDILIHEVGYTAEEYENLDISIREREE